MDKKSIVVTVLGSAGTGKSTLLYLMKDMLKKHGFEIIFDGGTDFKDENAFDEYMSRNLDLKITAVKEKCKIVFAEDQLMLDFKKVKNDD